MDDLDGLSRSARLAYLTCKAPNRVLPLLLKNRYPALTVVLNLPGNALIGDGGIGFAAGISGLYSLPGYLFSLLIAVAPVPLIYRFA